MTTIPTDPEQLEAWRRDPAAYEAMETLHYAYEQLVSALDERVQTTGVLFDAMHEPMRAALAEKGKPMPTMGELHAARGRLTKAKAQWASALAEADALLYRRQQGGE